MPQSEPTVASFVLPRRRQLSDLLLLAGVTLLLSAEIGAQVHEPVLPNLTGAQLQEALDDAYSPTRQLDYGIARDTLFANVFRQNGRLECQYTGFQVDLPDGVDPTTYVFDRGINTEHLYPRSKGAATGNGLADMHHLYPTREGVNADRASLPFDEIPDNQTQRWYYLDQQRSSPPSSNRDAYSEGTGSAFEPREEVKGDIARAIFYFYTMYRDQAVAADPTFFSAQASTLCDWHATDPVDQAEYERTLAIERAQGNINPFVLDCSLADRTNYCPTRSAACQAVPTSSPSAEVEVTVFPNPAVDQLVISATQALGEVALYNLHGQQVRTYSTTASSTVIDLPTQQAEGLYVLRIPRLGVQRKVFLRRL